MVLIGTSQSCSRLDSYCQICTSDCMTLMFDCIMPISRADRMRGLAGVSCRICDVLRPNFRGCYNSWRPASYPAGETFPMGIRYLVFAALLPAVPLMSQGLAAGPTDECRTAPDHQSSKVGHWYYRVDRTNHRKCWYVGPAGKVRSVTRKPGPHRVRVTHRTSKAVAEPAAAVLPIRAEQPVLPIRAAVLVADNAQGIGQTTSQHIAQPKSQNIIISARWPDPVTANGHAVGASGLADIAGAHAGSTVGSQSSVPVNDPYHSSARAELGAPEAAPSIDRLPKLALLAGGLVAAGVVGCMMFRHSGTRRRDVAARAYAANKWLPRDESILPVLARASMPGVPAADTRYFQRPTAAAQPELAFLASGAVLNLTDTIHVDQSERTNADGRLRQRCRTSVSAPCEGVSARS
jgi:hypothetical protein